ncbi:hypothetical protein M3Y95_00210000 [Aphelenchoides besseyi]|nr:hypothetical protein M3Y95_00210000 [Aphelenchoides besseyi]
MTVSSDPSTSSHVNSTSGHVLSSKAQLLQKRRDQWKELFTERIYLNCNQTHPGMGMEHDAVVYITEILNRILFTLLEQEPRNLEDLSDKVKSTFPSTLASFVMKNHDPHEELLKIKSKNKSKESKSLSDFYYRLQAIAKDVLGNLEDVAVMVFVLIIEDVLYDILSWSGTYVNKLIVENNTIITLPSLKTALNADRGLAELVENLFVDEEEEYGTIGAFHQVAGPLPSSPPSKRSDTRMPSSGYEKICQTFKTDEFAFMEDVSTICNVFRRRLETGISKDTEGKNIMNDIFGNVAEIFELTIKIHRTIEDALEMSDPPCLGAGLSELAEGMEFDVYIPFMEIFREPLNIKLARLVRNPKYKTFFDMEDKTYSTARDGHTFRMAVKYVLPALLHSVYSHFGSYLNYIKLLNASAHTEMDKRDLYDVEGYLTQVSKQIDGLGLPAARNFERYSKRSRRTVGQSDHIGKIIQIQRNIDGWVGKEIGFLCNEFIREGDLFKFRHGPTIAENLLRTRNSPERHIFLFDHLLVICKAVKSSKSMSYKYKDQFDIRKTDIIDLEDEDDLKNAFKIRSGAHEAERHVTLFCSNPEDKEDWMMSLVEMQTAGILHRMRDSYLKEEERRIPLMIPTPNEYRYAEPDTDENVVFEDYTHNSGVPVVRSGTILKLVERLTYPHYIDNEFVKTFMTTYRSFCSPIELLSLLIERFNIPVPQVFAHLEQQPVVHSPKYAENQRCLKEVYCHYRSGGPLAGRYDTVQSHGLQSHNQITPANLEHAFRRFREEYKRPIQQKVMKIMHHWVRYHFYDFENDPVLLQQTLDFLNGNDKSIKISVPLKKLCMKIIDAIKRKQAESNSEQVDSTHGDEKEEPKSGRGFMDGPEPLWHVAQKGDLDSYDLLTLHPLEIGRQVTLLHFCLYRAIKPIELVDAAWTKQEKYQRSPQLLKLIDHSTKLTYWVAKSIVETESLEERVEMFSRVLEIMCVFEELNNFNGVVAFYSALNCSSVFRLKESQSRLDREKKSWYERFQQLCQPHWKEMLMRLRSIDPPCVPFAGTYLSQIFFFETGKSTYVQTNQELHAEQDPETQSHVTSRKLVSFMKCRKIAAVIREIQMYQNQPYTLKVEPSIRQFFESINPLNGFKDKDEFETYLYDQSNRIEPKDGEILNPKPRHTGEALRSPGIKPPKSASHQSSSFHRSKSTSQVAHRSGTSSSGGTPKMAPKSTVTSPVQKSCPAPLATAGPTPPSSGHEDHFAIVDFSPGFAGRWPGESGRINQAFTSEYMTQPMSSGGSPKSPVAPASTPGFTSSGRRLPPAPLSANETRFNFPPTNAGSGTFPLTQPPAVRRRQSDRSTSNKTAQPSNGGSTLPTRRIPTLPPKSPPFIPKAHISSHTFVEQVTDENTQPSVPPRQMANEKRLPAPLPVDALSQLISGSRSPSPRSPTVSLLVPLPHHSGNTPPSSSSHQNVMHSESLYDPSEAVAPPRPPKTASLSRHPSNLSTTTTSNNNLMLVATEEELKPPPRPPKTVRSNSDNSTSPSVDPRLINSETPSAELVFDCPPIPPKPSRQRPT